MRGAKDVQFRCPTAVALPWEVRRRAWSSLTRRIPCSHAPEASRGCRSARWARARGARGVKTGGGVGGEGRVGRPPAGRAEAVSTLGLPMRCPRAFRRPPRCKGAAGTLHTARSEEEIPPRGRQPVQFRDVFALLEGVLLPHRTALQETPKEMGRRRISTLSAGRSPLFAVRAGTISRVPLSSGPWNTGARLGGPLAAARSIGVVRPPKTKGEEEEEEDEEEKEEGGRRRRRRSRRRRRRTRRRKKE